MTASEMSLVPYFRQYIRQVLPLELFSDGELRRALTAVRPGWERDEAMLFSLAQDFYRDIELSNWDESKHPRGQPENAGEFAEKPLAKDSETTDNSRVGEKISVTLWRAADDDIVVGSASFSTDRDAAKAYLDNPGFGGTRLWKAELEIDPNSLLDLHDLDNDDALEKINEIVEKKIKPGAIGIDELIPRIADQLQDAGIEWVRVKESYPVETETYIFVGTDDPEMEEADDEDN